MPDVQAGPQRISTRRGDTIEIEGDIDHWFDDRYDFNQGGPYSSEPRLLEQHGRAKPFGRIASWKRRVVGTIQVDDERLQNPQFKWQDIAP